MLVSELSPHFQELLDGYKDGYMGAKNLAQSSRRQYEDELHRCLLFLQELGVTELKKVDSRHINEYMVLLDKKKLAGSSRRKKLVIVKSFFKWLQASGHIATNPAQQTAVPLRDEKEPRVLSEEEYKRLLAVVQKPRDRAIIQAVLQTGIRLSELQRLTLSDVEVPKQTRKGGLLRVLRKGGKTQTFYLNSIACEALAVWLQIRPAVETNALFTSTRLNPLSSRQIQNILSKYFKMANIKGAGVHSLRHTFATHQISLGTDIRTVQKFLGHKNLNTTALYINLSKQRQAAQIEQNALK